MASEIKLQVSILGRFIDIFISAFWGTVKERIADLVLVALAALFAWHRGTLSPEAWRENTYNACLPWAGLLCGVVTWHAFKTANILRAQLESETSPIIHPNRASQQQAKKKRVAYIRTKVYGIASSVFLICSACFYLTWNASQTAQQQATSKAPVEQQSTSSGKLRVVIDYISTDWGKPYNPRTLIMTYYYFKDVPTLSPIDVYMKLRIVNTTDKPINLEAWSFETASNPAGPWLRLLHVPGSPHLSIYIVGSVKNKRSIPIILNDFADSIRKPIEPQKEVSGWALFECPAGPPCLGWYQRVLLRDTQGELHTADLNLTDYNNSKSLESTPGISISRSPGPWIDMTHVREMRPFPSQAYLGEPKSNKEFAHLY